MEPTKIAQKAFDRAAVAEVLAHGRELTAQLGEQVQVALEGDRLAEARAIVQDVSRSFMSSLAIVKSNKGKGVDMASASGTSTGRGSLAHDKRVKHRCSRAEERIIKETLTHGLENDGFQWRKYGHKIILEADFPRLYYKCSYCDEYKCPAKKRVQQQNNENPPLFLVTYINRHTCEALFAPQPTTTNQQVVDFTNASPYSPWSCPIINAEEALVSSLIAVLGDRTPRASDHLTSDQSPRPFVMTPPSLDEISPIPYVLPSVDEMEMDYTLIGSLLTPDESDGPFS